MTVDTKTFWTKAQGKVIQLDYDFIVPMTDECCYCLTDGQVQMILGVLDYYGWSTRWYSESGTIDQSVISELQADLGARLMNGCCGSETVRYRYLLDGTLQKSTDDGETWEDAPNDDPRNNSTEYPPLGNEITDKRCAAATSGMLAVKQQVGDQLTDDMSTFTLGELIKTWVDVYIQTSNPFTALITIAVNQIFALVIATLRPALTEEVYETFKCILYCNMSEDAGVNNAQVEQIRADITDQIGGIAGIFLEHLIYLLGAIGTQNIIRAGLATEGDCSECCPTCGDTWDLHAPDPFYGNITERGDGYMIVEHGNATDPSGNWYIWVQGTSDADCCTIADIEALDGGWLDGNVLWVECGQPNQDIFHAGAIEGQCSWSILIKSALQFTAKITFTEPCS